MGLGSIWHWSILLLLLLPIWPAWRICRRAGIVGPLGILIVVPIVGLVLTWVFALIEWPIERRAKQLVK
jgi:hypothetical protein